MGEGNGRDPKRSFEMMKHPSPQAVHTYIEPAYIAFSVFTVKEKQSQTLVIQQ